MVDSSPIQILLVDDDTSVPESIARALKGGTLPTGITITQVTTVEQVRELISDITEGRFKIVLIDHDNSSRPEGQPITRESTFIGACELIRSAAPEQRVILHCSHPVPALNDYQELEATAPSDILEKGDISGYRKLFGELMAQRVSS